MNKMIAWQKALLTAGVLALSACGGSGNGNGTGVISPGGNAVAGVAFGQITGFGSVIVNGIEFTLSGSGSMTEDGQAVSEAGLHVGQVVKVQGTINDTTQKGTADTLVAESNVIGPVSNVDATSKTFVTLNQTVQVDDFTVFDGIGNFAALSTLGAGDGVAVSGFVDSNNVLLATYIQKVSALPASSLQLVGTVSNRGIGGTALFVVGNTTVLNNSGALLPANGDCVRMTGSFASSLFTANTIAASGTCDVNGANGNLGSVEGFIAATLSANTFLLNGAIVDVGSSPTYVGGNASNLVIDRLVRVSGTFNSGGALVADQITFE